MEYRQFGSKYVVRLDKGDEIVNSLMEFAKKENVTLASFQGIGATNHAKIGLFEIATKVYHVKELKGDFEIAPVVGNISTMNGEIYLHVHINLGDKNNKAYAGHLNSAVISATCEIFVDVYKGKVNRKKDESIGLNLITFD